jgi:fatty acid desaturase
MFDGDRINWYRSPIDKNTLKRLTERSDAKALARIVPQLLLTAALGAVAYGSWDYLPKAFSIMLFYIYGTVFSFLGLSGAGHELSHGTPFKTKFWNELFMRLTAFLTWTNYVHFRASHAGHHQLTTHSGRDLEVIQPITIRRRDYLYAFTCNPPAVWMALRTLVRHSVNRLEGEWEHRIFPDTEPGKRRAMVKWARFMLVGQTALAAGFIAAGQWRLLFLVTLAPFYAGWLNFLCWGTQHAGLVHSVPDFRLSCRTVLMNPIAQFLYWNMNYHVEHHMFAGVPFYNLAELRKAIEPDLPPASKGFRAAWKDILLSLRRQKVDPTYAIEPALPTTAHPPREGLT